MRLTNPNISHFFPEDEVTFFLRRQNQFFTTWTTQLSQREWNNPNFCMNNPNCSVNNPNYWLDNPNFCLNNPKFWFNNPNSGLNNPKLCFNNPNSWMKNPNSCWNNPNSCSNNPNKNKKLGLLQHNLGLYYTSWDYWNTISDYSTQSWDYWTKIWDYSNSFCKKRLNN